MAATQLTYLIVGAHGKCGSAYDIGSSMRRIVMFNWVTADGYFAGTSGDLDWVVPDEEQAQIAAKDISGFDTVLFGRRTYEMFEAFWGHVVLDNSGTVPDPHRAGRGSSEHGTIAIALNDMAKLVFSKTLDRLTWKNPVSSMNSTRMRSRA